MVRRMTTCIHELKEWPDFRWDESRVARNLASLRHRQGRLIERMEALWFDLRAEAVLATFTKSSPDSALRDITDLVKRGILVRDPGGGRSTSYSLAKVG
jgi:Fic family protein